MKKQLTIAMRLIISLFFLTSCSYNPFISTNQTTGNPVIALAAAGGSAAGVALLDAPKPLIPIVGLGGGMLGYYLTTLRHDSGGIIKGGGKVYQLGDNIGIDIPSDRLFEPNTDDLLPRAIPILDSVVAVLERYPTQDIFISGNTSGVFRARWEQNISEKRAKKISAYLWNAGITNSITNVRKLTYVGYGDNFLIANRFTNKGIRANSRIHIISFRSNCDLSKQNKGRDKTWNEF